VGAGSPPGGETSFTGHKLDLLDRVAKEFGDIDGGHHRRVILD
jgi:hypothetical protein